MFNRLRFYLLSMGIALACFSASAYAEDVLTPEVGIALQRAHAAFEAHRYIQAMHEIKEANKARHISDYDKYVIAQMQAAVATQLGDVSAALSAYEDLIQSSRTSKDMRRKLLLSEVDMAYRSKDYQNAITSIQHYIHEYGSTPQMQLLLVQSYYLKRDYVNVIQTVKEIIEADRAGNGKWHKPQEAELQMMAASATALHDSAQETRAYLLLTTYYPKREYWALLLHGLITNRNLPLSLQLDVYRIRLAVGDMLHAADFMNMTEIALQLHMPQLALDMMTQGYKLKVLGVGAGADRQARLKTMVEKAVAEAKAGNADAELQARNQKTGDALFLVGYNDVTFGETQKGLALMQQALKKGVRDSAIAHLHLGLAYMQAGQRKQAIAAFETIPETSAAYDIARLWTIKLSHT
ncbi:MAG: tetratricopeptide repeat protein [Acetobacter sp.]|nr:tetratricopeptide repeat protein [Acetobacter sp.]